MGLLCCSCFAFENGSSCVAALSGFFFPKAECDATSTTVAKIYSEETVDTLDTFFSLSDVVYLFFRFDALADAAKDGGEQWSSKQHRS